MHLTSLMYFCLDENELLPGDLYNYITNLNQSFVVLVNGEKVEAFDQGGYLTISREWNVGNKIEMDFNVTVKEVTTNIKVVEKMVPLLLNVDL